MKSLWLEGGNSDVSPYNIHRLFSEGVASGQHGRIIIMEPLYKGIQDPLSVDRGGGRNSSIKLPGCMCWGSEKEPIFEGNLR